MGNATIEKNNRFEKVCTFFNKSSNDNCYYKDLQSINVPFVLRYCCSEDFEKCRYYNSESEGLSEIISKGRERNDSKVLEEKEF